MKAFVVPKPGAKLSVEELKSLCATNLAEFKRPVEIDIRESLLKSAEKRIESKVEEMKAVESRISTATGWMRHRPRSRLGQGRHARP